MTTVNKNDITRVPIVAVHARVVYARGLEDRVSFNFDNMQQIRT